MTNDIRFRINTYIQLLKHIDDLNKKQAIIKEVEDLLDMLSATAETEIFLNADSENCDFYESDIRDAVKTIVEHGIVNKPLSAKQISELAKSMGIQLDETLVVIGHFIQKYKKYFATEDDICVITVRRGTGSNLYKFSKFTYGKASPTLEKCVETMIELFNDNEEIEATVMQDVLKEQGFSKGTICRAKANLNVSSKHIGGMGAEGKWIWTLKEV